MHIYCFTDYFVKLSCSFSSIPFFFLLVYHFLVSTFFNIKEIRAGTLSFLFQKRKKHAFFFFPKNMKFMKLTVFKFLKSIIFKVFEKIKEKKQIFIYRKHLLCAPGAKGVYLGLWPRGILRVIIFLPPDLCPRGTTRKTYKFNKILHTIQ